MVQRESPGGVRSVKKKVLPLLVAAVCAAAGCATVTSAPSARAASGAGTFEEAAGIRVEGLRLTAAGYILDFRYRVLDPSKAAPLLDGRKHPYLVDARGARLRVPETALLGSLRQTSRNGKVNRNHSYFILFANPARYLHAGDQVTLVVGDARLGGLTVEGREEK